MARKSTRQTGGAGKKKKAQADIDDNMDIAEINPGVKDAGSQRSIADATDEELREDRKAYGY